MMDNERMKRIKRAHEFDGPIGDASMHNPVINDIICRYAEGSIITREEALSQMVVLLAKDWDVEKNKLVEFVRMSSFPIVKPPG